MKHLNAVHEPPILKMPFFFLRGFSEVQQRWLEERSHRLVQVWGKKDQRDFIHMEPRSLVARTKTVKAARVDNAVTQPRWQNWGRENNTHLQSGRILTFPKIS